jgi:hypothetical protein
VSGFVIPTIVTTILGTTDDTDPPPGGYERTYSCDETKAPKATGDKETTSSQGQPRRGPSLGGTRYRAAVTSFQID